MIGSAFISEVPMPAEILARAEQLARSGRFPDVLSIRAHLLEEGFALVDEAISPNVTAVLGRLCRSAQMQVRKRLEPLDTCPQAMLGCHS